MTRGRKRADVVDAAAVGRQDFVDEQAAVVGVGGGEVVGAGSAGELMQFLPVFEDDEAAVGPLEGGGMAGGVVVGQRYFGERAGDFLRWEGFGSGGGLRRGGGRGLWFGAGIPDRVCRSVRL